MDNALINACKNNRLTVIKVLLEKEPNVNYADDSGKTPLLYCADQGNIDAVRMLIAAGADLRRTDNKYCSCIHHAVASGNKELLKLFLQAPELDVNHRNSEGETPLLWAAERGKRDLTELLLNAGAVDIPSNKSVKAIDVASEKGYAGVVELLLAPVKSTPLKKLDRSGVHVKLISCTQCGNPNLTNLDTAHSDNPTNHTEYAHCDHCGAKYLIVKK